MASPHVHPWEQKYLKSTDYVCPATHLQDDRGAKYPRLCWLCPVKAGILHSADYTEPTECMHLVLGCRFCGDRSSWVTLAKNIAYKRYSD